MGADFSVLIVDDVGTVRNFLQQTLVHLGIDNIDQASTAGQCLQLTQDNKYSIIFLDIELPDGNGKEIIEKLSDPKELEKFARENYYLKKQNEEIYLIEYEDSIKQKGDE